MRRDLRELAERTYDVVIIGAGIYGACAAWDAALRGLSVALVEKADFGHATSSKSLRVIHGGLRYLQYADFHRLRQSILERTTFMRIAPHLVHPLPFLIPTYGHGIRGKEILELALAVNDLVGWDRNRISDPEKYLPRGRVISRQECVRLCSGIEQTGLTGGAIVYDSQIFSSERLLLSFIRSATDRGAQAANYVEVFGLLKHGGRITGVKARDLLKGTEFVIRARVVVNAAGPWFEQIVSLFKERCLRRRGIRLSKAFNVLINRLLVPDYAVGVYAKNRCNDGIQMGAKGSRLLFLTPWHNRSLVGTVHLPYDCDPDNCHVTENEIEKFLIEINEAYPAAALERNDVCLTYGGLLPISDTVPGALQLIRRYRILDHEKQDGIAGLISMMGVKLTEARHVAEKTIDLVFTKLGAKPPKSATATTVLHGGQIRRLKPFIAAELQHKPPEVSPDLFQRLVQFYGSAYSEVLKYLPQECGLGEGSGGIACAEKKGHSRAYPIEAQSPGSLPRPGLGPQMDIGALICAEVRHGIREEMAQTLSDVMFRRTSLTLAGTPGEDSLTDAAAIMSTELGWNNTRTQREISETKMLLSARP